MRIGDMKQATLPIFPEPNVELLQGDCREVMANILDGSVDMVMANPPYGTTACKWDSIIPLEPMWENLKRIVKGDGVICLFGGEPFSSHLRLSNLRMFKYDWVWKKAPTNFLNSRHQPLRNTEIISVFYEKSGSYYPVEKDKIEYKTHGMHFKKTETVGEYDFKYKEHNGFAKPVTIIEGIKKEDTRIIVHPTQKPVALMEYLIKTYTDEGETVLDFCMGSGTTGVACKNLNRDFIGIEKDEKYFEIARNRIDLNA